MGVDVSKKFCCKCCALALHRLDSCGLNKTCMLSRRKYSNILQCEENFNVMTSACASLSTNVESMHSSLVRINTDYLVQIAELLNQMQLEVMEDDGKKKH